SAWLCFEENIPILFQYSNVAGTRTKHGVEITPVPNPPWRGLLEKKPGEMWLDVPLTGPMPMGKLSMFCDESIRPEQVEFWRVIGAAAGSALANLQREAEGKQTAALAAERVFLSSMAHNIHTRLASLSTVRSRYKLYEERNPSKKLRDINEQF